MNEQRSTTMQILVPLDGSPLAEQAIPYAASLLPAGGQIVLLRVIPRPDAIHDPLGGILMSEQEVLTRFRVMAGREAVDAITRWRRERDPIRMEVAIQVGDPAEQILETARERNVDLVVMASKGRGAFGRLALGSVADRVTRSADVPVVVVRPDDALADLSRPLIRRLVVPLDGSERSRAALPVAMTLARQLRASILLVSVIDFARVASPAMAYGAAFSQDLYEEVMAKMVVDARSVLDSSGARLMNAGIPVRWEVLEGSPAEAIIQEAEPGDLIVMTSHGHGGFKRWLLGSVAEKLVRHSPVPIVIVPARVAEHTSATHYAHRAYARDRGFPGANGTQPVAV